MPFRHLKNNITKFFLILSFLLVANIAFAVDVVDSDDVTVSATVVDPDADDGAGSGGGIVIPQIAVNFSGEAYPNAKVTLLKNGNEETFVYANADGYFYITLEEKYDNTILYTLHAIDIQGERSLLLNYPVVIRTGYVTDLSNIRFAPTVIVDKTEVLFGDYISVSGYAMPNRTLDIYIEGDAKLNFSLNSLSDGSYNLTTLLPELPKGDYVLHVKYRDSNKVSKLVRFIIGDTNRYRVDNPLNLPGDCNSDDIINLVDFSILAFWYKKDNPPVCVDLNKDRIVDLVDFSILAFYWTG